MYARIFTDSQTILVLKLVQAGTRIPEECRKPSSKLGLPMSKAVAFAQIEAGVARVSDL